MFWQKFFLLAAVVLNRGATTNGFCRLTVHRVLLNAVIQIPIESEAKIDKMMVKMQIKLLQYSRTWTRLKGP